MSKNPDKENAEKYLTVLEDIWAECVAGNATKKSLEKIEGMCKTIIEGLKLPEKKAH
jgi:hypothetical protein